MATITFSQAITAYNSGALTFRLGKKERVEWVYNGKPLGGFMSDGPLPIKFKINTFEASIERYKQQFNTELVDWAGTIAISNESEAAKPMFEFVHMVFEAAPAVFRVLMRNGTTKMFVNPVIKNYEESKLINLSVRAKGCTPDSRIQFPLHVAKTVEKNGRKTSKRIHLTASSAHKHFMPPNEVLLTAAMTRIFVKACDTHEGKMTAISWHFDWRTAHMVYHENAAAPVIPEGMMASLISTAEAPDSEEKTEDDTTTGGDAETGVESKPSKNVQSTADFLAKQLAGVNVSDQ